MSRDPLGSGDLIAGRRFAYAKAAAEDGDFRAAAEVLEQALERAPDWVAAWFALGEAREMLGEIGAAVDAFRAALRLDADDAQGAAARLALIGWGDAPSALPQAYVARLFDQYAPRFETHLTATLFYRGPVLIEEAVDAAAPGRRFGSALDIGCGTGLMGQTLRERVNRLTGVDLSPAMIEKAGERGVYDALIVGDATALLRREFGGDVRSDRRRRLACLCRRPRALVRRCPRGPDGGRGLRILTRDNRRRRLCAR